MPIEYNSAWTRFHRQVALTRSLGHGPSDRLFWQVALTSTSYSFNNDSANFVRLTLTTYSTIDPGTLAVTNRIWNKSGPLGPTKPFSAAFVGIWGPNNWPTRTTTGRDMQRPTLNRASYLLNVCRYLLPYIRELHYKSHRPPTMCRFMMLYYMLCNIRIIRPGFCLPSGWVSGRCPRSMVAEIWLDLREHTIHDCFFPFDSHRCQDHAVLNRNPPVWWDPQSMIPQWLREKGLIVWPNVVVCRQEYSQEDLKITALNKVV